MFTIVIIIYFYQDILYNFNVCRAKQTETGTYLEWFLEQPFLS